MVERTPNSMSDPGRNAARRVADVGSTDTADPLYASLVESLPIFVIRKDVQGRITYANQRLADQLGKSVDELIGKSDFDLFPPQLAKKYRNDDLCVMETGELFIDVEENRTSDGQSCFFEVRKTPVRSALGRIVGTQAIFWDVTEKHRAEEALNYERFLLHALMDNIPDCIYFKDRESRFVRVSKAMAEKFGVTEPRRIVGKTDADFFDVEHAEEALADEKRIMESGEGVLNKIEHEVLQDGREAWSYSSKVPLRDDRGNIVGTLGVSRDVTDKTRAEQRLSQERDLLHTLINHLPDLIYVKDRYGRYIVVNEAVRQLLDLKSTEEMVGKCNVDFLDPEQARLEQEDDTMVLTSGEALVEREEQITDRQGNVLWLLTSKVPIKDKQGNVTGLVGIDRNITNLKRTEEALRAAKDAADMASRTKSDFLANVSHEIRTPMNAIIGMTDLLLETSLDDTQREYLTMILQSGETLLALINDILDFSKIEAGKLELDEGVFELREGIGDTMKALAIRAHSKGLELALDVDNDVPDRLRGDLGRVRQIVMNLVGNAIKFTERGEVLLEVHTVEQAANHVELRFDVTDTGIGIPPEKCQKIFEEFEQVDTSITRKFGGSGLGLAISSKLIQLMDGTIRVTSTLGKGSTFSFTARFAISDEPIASAEVPSRRLAIADTSVLIVDDNSTNRRILYDMLSNWGMQPSLAADAEEAMLHLQTALRRDQPIPLVVSDINMPGVDGFQLVERIHDSAGARRPAIILLTSGVRIEDTGRWRRLGVSAHLMKPIKQSELFEAIVEALQISSPHRPMEVVSEAQSRGHIGKLRILLAEDNVVNQKLAVAAFASLGHDVTLAQNGKQAVAAASQTDYDVIFMDVQMPEMDGITATRAIRELEQRKGGHVPIVAMTAHAMKGDREHCLESGMDDYLSKPIRIVDLSSKLEDLFGENPKPPEVVSASPADQPVNWESALQSVNGNEKLLRDVVEAFVDDVPRLCNSIRESWAEGNLGDVQRAAHSLKGSLLFLEAQTAIEIAQDIETRSSQGVTEGMQQALTALDENVSSILAYLQTSLAGAAPWLKC